MVKRPVSEANSGLGLCGENFEPDDIMGRNEDDPCENYHECILDPGHEGEHECSCGFVWREFV